MKSVGFRIFAMAWALGALLLVWRLTGTLQEDGASKFILGLEHDTGPRASGPAADWFYAVRPHCNEVEVRSYVASGPAPGTFEGTAYTAACFALAGEIDEARDRILSLERDRRWQAAGIVFNQAHPIADRGDDASAGPIMKLVVEFWPNHYQALYHAGAASYALGAHDEAKEYLTEFLRYYAVDDGWTTNATYMLDQMGR